MSHAIIKEQLERVKLRARYDTQQTAKRGMEDDTQPDALRQSAPDPLLGVGATQPHGQRATANATATGFFKRKNPYGNMLTEYPRAPADSKRTHSLGN